MKSAQFYTNDSIRFLVNRRITEFDISKAGLHALLRLECISTETYEYWKTRPKHWIVRHIGIHFSSRMGEINRMISDAVDKFIDVNGIRPDNIISKKRDALFTFGTIPKMKTIDGFRFVEKNVYTSYVNIGKIEMFYNGDSDRLEIKSIDTRFVNAHPIKNFIQSAIRLMERVEKRTATYKDIYRHIHNFRNRYVRNELPSDFYRELTMDNPFVLFDSVTGKLISVDTIDGLDTNRYSLVRSHNFQKFVVPFINILPLIYRKSKPYTR